MPILPSGYTQHPTNPQYAISPTGAWVPISSLNATASPSVPYTGSVAGTPVKQVDVNAIGGYIGNLKNQVKNGLVDSLTAKNQLNAYLLSQFADDPQGNFSEPERYKQYQAAVQGGTTALFSDLGTIKNPKGQFGEVDLNGNFRATSTTVNQSTTSLSGGTTSTTRNVLPLDITSNLGPGAQGEDVRKLQQWLKDQGYFPKDQEATGYYGDITKNAVASWQKASGINAGADAGWFGPKSQAYLRQYAVKSTITPEENAFYNSDSFKSLPNDQQQIIKSISDAISANDTDTKDQLTAAFNQAKAIADPYFKQQISIALDELNRGFISADEDLAYNEKTKSQRLLDLQEDIKYAKDILSLDQQADLKAIEQKYKEDLEATRNDLAASGFTSSSRRNKTETLLSENKGDLVESTNRAFAVKTRDLTNTGMREARNTQQEIERLRKVTQENKTSAARKVEEAIGTDKLISSGIPGISPLGGLTGNINTDMYNDIISATKRFVF